MSSSEIADYGRFSGQRSNFSTTCYRLSQYLKEKRSFGDLSLGLSHNFVPSGNPRPTMDLLPMIEKSGHRPMDLFPTKEEATKIDTRAGPEKSQMTIFYSGQVIVFNDFPAEKAKEIMLLASSSSGGSSNTFPYSTKTTTSAAPKQLPESSAAVSKVVPCFGNPQRPPHPPNASDLPIARRASLTRFLEKRKDRIVSKGPYQIGNPKQEEDCSSSSYKAKAEERKAWLGLGANFPVKIEH